MFQARRAYLFLSALALASTLAGAQTATASPEQTPQEEGYHFAPVNQYSLELTASYWNPILEYVSRKSGVRLNLRLGRTSAETTAALLAGQADFAFTNHMFSPERVRMGWKVFGRRNSPPVNGQIVVPAESPIKSLADLGGQPVAFPGAEAFVAYKVTYGHLLEKKVSVTPVFAGNLDAAFTQMLSGRVPAIGTNSQMVTEYAAREGRKFRVLWSSPTFNDLALMVSPRVPAAKAKAVAKAFLEMHKDPAGREVLDGAVQVVKASAPLSFVPATDADYASYRNFYHRAPASLR